ncbi:MAG: META domain-containing protein [Shinella sp.]|nr:META domain-containing protein [Shinella sp.]
MRIPVSAITVAFVCLQPLSPALAVDPVPPGLGGAWLAEDINGGGVMDNLQTTLEIRPDGSYGGNGGCNTYRGNLKVENGGITFAPAAATRKMCAPAVMDQEQKFFDALGTVKSWRLENGVLHLSDKDGGHALRLSTLPNGTDVVIRLPGQPVAVDRRTITYQCDGDMRVGVEYINARPIALAVMTFGQDVVVASNVIAGSGAKYAGGQYEWWTKGPEAILSDLSKPVAERDVSCRPAG